ncbi:MAG: hypothetical protein QXT14_02770 [Candidatus Bathyarchaeia archaeon]
MPVEDLAAKGESKLRRKVPTMKKSYRAARDRAVSHFRAVGFGPTRTSNYEGAWATMPDNYDRIVGTDIYFTKWRENWISKMRE